MAIKTIYIGSWGPLKYDDTQDVNDPDGLFAGVKQKTIVTDGTLDAAVVTSITVSGVSDVDVAFTNNTTGNASNTKHGFLPRLSNDATEFLDGQGNWDNVTDSDLSLSDNTDNDVSDSAHGFVPKGRKFGGATHYSQFEADGTLVFNGNATVWDDLRILIGNLTRPGASDPSWVTYAPNGGAISTYLLEFAKNNWATFTTQMPHNYLPGSDIYVHIHWTPGTRGNEENGKTVGWKIEYTWTDINGNFADMASLDLSDACDGTDHKHQMTPDVVISGSGMTISSMLLCNILRTDTGTDDTWASSTSGQLPLLLEVDFHYEIDTIGSRQRTAK
jgi:hypothetical protein